MKLLITAGSLLLICIGSGAQVTADAGNIASRNSYFSTRAVRLSKAPFVGEWSNGRGETLVITARSLQFGSDKPVTYRDVTKVTDGNLFYLEITSPGKLNYFTRYVAVSLEENREMKTTMYDSYADMFNGENSQGEATWDRDK
jgi:hypothetical protein